MNLLSTGFLCSRKAFENPEKKTFQEHKNEPFSQCTPIHLEKMMNLSSKVFLGSRKAFENPKKKTFQEHKNEPF